MDLSFEKLCTRLATTDGGYTLWIGAGAAVAITGGAAPSWSGLVEELSAKVPAKRRPRDWEALSFPAKLDRIASHMGHAEFRRALRRSIVEPMLETALDVHLALDQATIAARSSSVVSFNVEMLSSLPFTSPRGGGSFNPRPYLEPTAGRFVHLATAAGQTADAVYFPHGLLDLTGQCVITESEYGLHGISLAVSTAVSACLGGDLLILGMSLSDAYLRDAILKGRRWIRRIYWVDEVFQFEEWARVADVQCVRTERSRIWSGIARAHLHHEKDLPDRKLDLARHRDRVKSGLASAVQNLRTLIETVPLKVQEFAERYRDPHFTGKSLHDFARQIEDLGLDVPDLITNDPRYKNAP